MENDLKNKEMSYLVGLFQTDGNLYETDRNRGKFKLELNIRDEDIIYKISNLIKYNYKISKRERITNFGESSTISITVCNINFRNLLKDWGVPAGKKSEIIEPPFHKSELSTNDYIRGLYDGDGSIGYTKNEFPFVSFVTKSEKTKDFLVDFISKITLNPKKELKRNKRDGVYNISITKEDAVIFCNEIYSEDCLSINRKYIKAQEVKKWERPKNMKRRDCQRKKWTKEEDEFIQTNSIEKCLEKLNRNEYGIKTRLWKLKKI